MNFQKSSWKFPYPNALQLIAKLFVQELHLHGNSIGDEGVRALMLGLSSHKGWHFFGSHRVIKLSCFIV
jgi:hypothetical protein